MLGWPKTCLKIDISCLVASSICWGFVSLESVPAPKSMIFAANSFPLSFSMHLLTVELTPLKFQNKNVLIFVRV